MKLSFENLKNEIAEILDINSDEVHTDTALTGSDHWDSFAMLSAVALVTQYTEKQVSLGDLSNLATVNDFVSLLQNLKES
ncbi:acyl carrier protein [Pseudoalteromonas sp. S16_S37]|uniref:acyl carrier protein n=1 Tax=Pseudoalteromonas sp. S16_S37 TaxID=2720228 RepID=UPI0016802052|nr:acyl carrier protein [Pseudoalteromonas sp. S16_S37]MBD1582310.1 acyl carrier protein [Pseudoalteromonas sp. S16_S37]